MQKGDIIRGKVNKIIDKGVNITIDDDSWGYLPKTQMTSGVDDNGNIILKKGQLVDVAVSYINKDNLISLSQKLYDTLTVKEQKRKMNELKKQVLQIKQELVCWFDSEYEKGMVFEAEVKKITTRGAYILLNNIEGFIPKDELNYNVIESPSEVIFEGEIIHAVYIGIEKNELLFSLKYLNDKPYDEELYDLSLEELLKICGLSSNKFIGQARQYGEYTFIENLYSNNDKEKGRLLTDPFYGYNLRALVPNNNFIIEAGKYYEVEIALVDKQRRIERNQLFQFRIKGNADECDNPYRNDVLGTFSKLTDPSANIALANTLTEVGKNMYSGTDRMFFELIQNADDASAKNGVSISIYTIGDYLIFCHNGRSFDRQDFVAITSSANGTKKTNEGKTGYKGIGFKSVFTDSEEVIIKTGGYQFKFDKSDPLFSDFEKYYRSVNNNLTDNQFSDFLKKYEDERNGFKGVKSIPWQLKPIWIYDISQDLVDFSNSNVSIFLKVGEKNINDLEGYKATITKLINDPKFMLFLRHTKRLSYENYIIQKKVDNNIIELKNSFSKEKINVYRRFDFTINVDDEEFQKQGIDIRTAEKTNHITNETETCFVDLQDREIDTIPPKIAVSRITQISFAIESSDNDIFPKKKDDISIFAFLPTLVKEFKFPFYINANFLLDSPRLHILPNPWNYFLMREIGGKIVEWCASLCKNEFKNALNVLIREYFDEETSEDTNSLAHHFNQSYKQALKTEAFILSQSGILAKQKDIIFDQSGLSVILGAELFCKILDTDKELPSPNIDFSILSCKIFEDTEHIDGDSVVEKMVGNEELWDWYINTDSESKDKLNKWLIGNDCKNIINLLPLFEFEDGCKSPNDIDSCDKYVVVSTKFIHLKSIITKLGLHCSIPFDKEELYQIDETKLFERIYKKIVIHNDIVKKLHSYNDICAGVGADEYYYGNYYAGLLSDLREGEFITNEQEQALSQDKPVYLTADDLDISEDRLNEYNDRIYQHYICVDFPNTISQIIAETALTPEEKLLLISTGFYGVGETRIKEIELFNNIENSVFFNGGEPTALKKMLPFRENAPKYVKPYMICKEESFAELAPYLINGEEEFEKVVWKNIDNIDASPIDIIEQYGLEGQSLRDIIGRYNSNDSLAQFLSIVESSDAKTKEFYLDKISAIKLNDGQQYKKDSFEYRVLQIAANTLSSLSDFSKKIFYNDTCITKFSVSDEVICEYAQNGETKKVKMSLAKLLPQYQNISDSINKVKDLFESKKDLDKFFLNSKTKPLNEIFDELNLYLTLSDKYQNTWPNKAGNAQQYLFSIYYRKTKYVWHEPYRTYDNFYKKYITKQRKGDVAIPYIDLSQERQAFISDLLDFLCGNNILIEKSPFADQLRAFFKGKYFDCDYVFAEGEQLFPYIEQWADNNKKKTYLIQNGVKTVDSLDIQFRKLFLEDKPIDFIDKLSDDDLKSGIEFIAMASGYNRPFVGENQKSILLYIKDKCKYIESNWNVNKVISEAAEWETPEYNKWIDGHYPHIFIYHGILPKQLSYQDEVILNYEDDSQDYFYYRDKQKLFICDTKKIEEILFEVAKENKSDFNFDDYQILMREKVNISEKDVEEKDKTIETLSEENRKKDEIIEELQAKLKAYENVEIGNNDEDEGNQRENLPTPTIEKGKSGSIGDIPQLEAQLEAQRRLMQDFPQWTFPDNYGEADDDGKPYNFSTVEIEDENDNTIPIVLKSYKKTDEPFKINTTEWDYLIKEKAVLLIYIGSDIKRVYVNDLIRKQANIAITFSTENLDIEDKVNAFADSLHYFNELHFDFDSFNISSRVQSAKELYQRNKRAFFANDNTEDDI